MAGYKAVCNNCGWESEFELSRENIESAVSTAYRDHDAHHARNLGEGKTRNYCPGDSLQITGPEGIFKVGTGGAPIKIGETRTKLPPLPDSALARDWDEFPLTEFLTHAAAKYKEMGGPSHIVVEATEQGSRVTRTESDEMATSTTRYSYTAKRVKSGWILSVHRTHDYSDRRGDMYSDYSESDFEIELTNEQVADPEVILQRLRI